MIRTLAIAGVMVGATVAQAEAQQRIDVYDKHSRREGYVIVNERQGRADFYDRYSRRQGYATFKARRPDRQEPPGNFSAFNTKPAR